VADGLDQVSRCWEHGADGGFGPDHPLALASCGFGRQTARAAGRGTPRVIDWFREGTTLMRKFGGAMLLAVLLVGGVSAIASGEPGAKRKITTLRFYGPTVQLKLIDAGDAGFSLGDQSVFSDDLLTARNGNRVGFDGGVCTVVRVEDASTQTGTLQCLVSYSLSGGQITTQHLSKTANLAPSGTETGAITGGTGRYRTARGSVKIEFLDGGAAANVTLSIRR
jgi:hypothetical protein